MSDISWMLKYRPRCFNDVTGQLTARLVLQRMIKTGDIRSALLFHGSHGSGKAQPLDSLVLTPTGYRRMGDLAVGDPVIDPEGQPSEVTGVFPQGTQDIYRVTFNDGSSCECTGDHLWPVRRWKGNGSKNTRALVTEVRSLSSIPLRVLPWSSGSLGAAWNLAASLRSDLDMVEDSLPIEPYFLGLLLGDGTLSGGSVLFTSADQELADAVSAALPAEVILREASRAGNGITYRLTIGRAGGFSNPLALNLRSLGLTGCKSSTKFIPESYKIASAKTRLAVLQGLLDTDGSATPGGADFGSASRQLRDDVVWLARSLGYRVTISERKINGTRVNGESYFDSYRAQIKGSQDRPILFRLARKVVASTRVSSRWREGTSPRRFMSVEFSHRAEAQCISVSAPSQLYVTDDFIPTHNTSMARIVAAALNCEIEDPIQRPCGECAVCSAVAEGRSADVTEIDAASSGLAADMRSLRETVRFAAQSRYRVVIIDEAHAMSTAGFQALLKTLEEPPANTVIMLVTTHLDKVPDTIASRCLSLEFRRLTEGQIATRLAQISEAEGLSLSSELARAIAARCRGIARDSVGLLEQCVMVGVRTPEQLAVLLGEADHGIQILRALVGSPSHMSVDAQNPSDFLRAFGCIEEALGVLPSAAEVVAAVVRALRRQLCLTVGGADAKLSPPATDAELALVASLDPARCVGGMRVIWEYYAKIAPAADAYAALDLLVTLLGQVLSPGRLEATRSAKANLQEMVRT